MTTVEYLPGLWADTYAPDQPGNYPVAALIFGGGWTLGDRTQLAELADNMASTGMVVINGEHHTLLHGRRLPEMVEEVDCLAAAAAQLAAPHLGGPAESVWLVGFSSGAHLAAVSVLTDSPSSGACPYDSPDVAGMIGLAGPYDLDLLWSEGILTHLLNSETLWEHFPELAVFLQEQSRAAMQLFLRLLTGATPEAPDSWKPLNPINLAGSHPSSSFLLITGSDDQVVPPSHTDSLADALAAGGHQVTTHDITEASHIDLTDPQTVGDTIATFITEGTDSQGDQ